jgi:uncharacterized protein YutE (UPF0331/DUF86 family)
MAKDLSKVLGSKKEDVRKSLKHLQYSYNKVMAIDLKRDSQIEWDEETLETLESFASRFARSADLIVSHLLRSLVLGADPGFQGTIIDVLNFSEKMGWIESASNWRRIRELRNVAAHEYTHADLIGLYREVFTLTPEVLKIATIL